MFNPDSSSHESDNQPLQLLEFASDAPSKACAENPEIKEAFDVYDQDSSGEIDRLEFRALIGGGRCGIIVRGCPGFRLRLVWIGQAEGASVGRRAAATRLDGSEYLPLPSPLTAAIAAAAATVSGNSSRPANDFGYLWDDRKSTGAPRFLAASRNGCRNPLVLEVAGPPTCRVLFDAAFRATAVAWYRS